jgi:LmbE family N-acetylglucosaminyl deacetylase
MIITRSSGKTVAVIVAHPDDETLWTGGTIMSYPSWNWFIACMCRGSDKDRSPRFHEALRILNSDGIMGDMEDGPEQIPLDDKVVERTVLNLLPTTHFDLIITHNPKGEYTRHLRHEETGKAVIRLWNACKISANELWTFAYSDENKKHLPMAEQDASIYMSLTEKIWLQKYSIITEIYGFKKGGFEAETTPKAEAFRRLVNTEHTEK